MDDLKTGGDASSVLLPRSGQVSERKSVTKQSQLVKVEVDNIRERLLVFAGRQILMPWPGQRPGINIRMTLHNQLTKFKAKFQKSTCTV